MRLHQFLKALEKDIKEAEEMKDEDLKYLRMARANERFIACMAIFEPKTLNSLLSAEERVIVVKIGLTLVQFMLNADKEDE